MTSRPNPDLPNTLNVCIDPLHLGSGCSPDAKFVFTCNLCNACVGFFFSSKSKKWTSLWNCSRLLCPPNRITFVKSVPHCVARCKYLGQNLLFSSSSFSLPPRIDTLSSASGACGNQFGSPDNVVSHLLRAPQLMIPVSPTHHIRYFSFQNNSFLFDASSSSSLSVLSRVRTDKNFSVSIREW